jgi:hypothetical protein
MATTKKKLTPTKPKPSAKPPAAAKPKPKSPSVSDSAAASTSAEAWDPSKSRLLVSRLRPRGSTLAPSEIADFDSLSTDAQRSTLGARTKARAVAADAARWAASIDRQLREYAVLREHYDPSRFAYYLLRLHTLLQELGKQGSSKESRGAAKSDAETAFLAARAARNKLLLALKRFAGRRTIELDLISEARGNGTTDDTLVDSLKDLVTLAEGWLKTGAPFLLKTARLTPALLHATRAAADAVASSGASATEAGPAPARDSPAVNLVEGWMLDEMMRVYEDFEAAREESQVIERLIPGPGTRALFGHHSKKVAAKAPDESPATP